MKEQIVHDSNTKEYKLGHAVASTLRDRTNNTIGDLLTLIEVAMEAGPKTDSLKQLIKQAMWKLTDDNQHTVYYAFGQEPYQLRDSTYIQDVLAGKDPTDASGAGHLLPSND